MLKIITKTCKDCEYLYTGMCPIRVWARNEKYVNKKDVNLRTDYCSRFKQGRM